MRESVPEAALGLMKGFARVALMAEPIPKRHASRTEKVLTLSLGSGLTMLASLASSMVAARVLSKHDLATIRQTFLAYDFVSPLLMLGLPNAVYYFLPREKGSKRGVILDNMVLLIAGGVIFSLFIALGGHQLLAMRFDNPDLRHTLKWLIPYPLIVMPIAGLSAVLVCADRTKALTIYNVISSFCLALGSLLAVVTTRSYAAPILVRVIIPALFLPLGIWLMFTAVLGPVRAPWLCSMREMIHYSVPLGLGSLLGSITLQMDSVIVASMSTPENFAVYINGAMELPLIGIITGSITTIIFAEMAELCSTGDMEAALQLFHKASIKSATFLFPTMCFLLVTAVPFITFMYSEKYHESVWPFFIYLFILPVRIVAYGAALMALGMTKVILTRSVFELIINALLCFTLVKIMGYLGAAIATLLTLYLWTIPFNLSKIKEGFGITWRESLPFWRLTKLLGLCVMCMPLAALGTYAISITAFGKLAISALLYWPTVGFLLYRFMYIEIPSKFEQWLPSFLRLKL